MKWERRDSGVIDLINLNDIDIGFSSGNYGRRGGKDLRNGIVSCGLAGVWSYEAGPMGKLDLLIKQKGKSEVRDQMDGGVHLSGLRGFIMSMGL